MPTTRDGCAICRIASVKAPVPQPTSSQRAPGAEPIQRTNSGVIRLLQRPMNRSYAAPCSHTSTPV